MGNIMKIIGGIGLLIGMYLVFSNYKAVNTLANTGGSLGIKLTQVLQGRDSYMK